LVTVILGEPEGSNGGEAMVGASPSRAAGTAVASYAIEDEPSDEFGDTETLDAISIIRQLRQRMNATE
jgi:hypothetical protein